MTRAVMLNDRALIRLRGAETQKWLNAIVTQDVSRARAGAPAFSTLLTPQGKIVADFIVWAPAPDEIFLDVAAALANDLVKRLTLYRLRAKVDIARDPRAGVAQILEGDDAFDVDDSAADPRTPILGRRLLARDSADLAAALKAHEMAPLNDYHAHRAALGVAEAPVDFAPDSVWPTDVGYDFLNGVDYRKGCFIGQEVASRMKRKGGIRRRPLIATTQAPAMSPILADGHEIGSVGASFGGRAPAIVRLDRWADAAGHALTAAGAPVSLAACPWMDPAETV